MSDTKRTFTEYSVERLYKGDKEALKGHIKKVQDYVDMANFILAERERGRTWEDFSKQTQRIMKELKLAELI